MSDLPTALYRPADVAELDRTAIEDVGIDGYALMTRAGEAAFEVLRHEWPSANRVVVLCGGGNNGGDGYVIARLGARAGLQVRVMALSDPARLKGSAARAASDCSHELTIESFAVDALYDADVVVDALLGTGLDRDVTGQYADAIEALQTAAAPVLAVDIPSGVSGDTGAVMGCAVRAQVTITFIGLKRGLFTGAAPGHTGRLVFRDLAVPNDAYARVAPAAYRITGEHVAAELSPRSRASHKGAYGRVLVVGGDLGMGGAARLAGEAAARGGAGLVTIGTRAEHVPAILAARPELMVRPVASDGDLSDAWGRATVLALGPGLGTHDWGRARFGRLQQTAKPAVYDADALNLLAEAPDWQDQRVITPHPGEAARLLGTTTREVQSDRFAAVEQLQARYGGVAVLKGAGTMVTNGTTRWICDRGNPGMASGGMGDVLTGVIAGLMAQGLSPLVAASLGVWCHATAADRAAQGGERGLLAGDLLDGLREVVNPV